MKMVLGLSLSMSTPNFLLLLVFVVSATAASSSFTGVHAGVACAPKEREALLAWYPSTWMQLPFTDSFQERWETWYPFKC